MQAFATRLLARPPSALALIAALVVSAGWTLLALGFLTTAADDVPAGVLVGVTVLMLALTAWQVVLIRRVYRGVPRTGRRVAITLLILTVPVLVPPMGLLSTVLAGLVLGPLAIGLVLAHIERRPLDALDTA